MIELENKILAEAQSERDSNPDKAVRLLEGFVEQWKGALRARLLLASLYSDDYGAGWPAAERVYREALSMDPSNLAGLCGLALLNGRVPGVGATESLDLLAKAVEVSGGDPEMLMNYANKAWDLGNFGAALEAFERLQRLARERGQNRLSSVARQSLKQVRAKKRPTGFYYAHPEI